MDIMLSIDPRIKIRKVSENDIKDICRIMLSTDPYVALGYTEDMCIDTVLSGLEEGWTAVAEYEEEVVGFIIFRVFDGFPLGGYIRALAVDRRFRGKGVGRALMRYAEEIIFRYRRNVFLLVSSFNYDAIRFYKSLGYELVGEIKMLLSKAFQSIYFVRKGLSKLFFFSKDLFNISLRRSRVIYYSSIKISSNNISRGLLNIRLFISLVKPSSFQSIFSENLLRIF